MAAADTQTKVLEVLVDNNKAISAIAEFNQLIDEQKDKQKALNDAFKAGEISQTDYLREMAKSKEETKTYSRSVQELSKEIQNNVKQSQEQDGSLRGLRAALSNATKEYDALSRAERTGARGAELQKHINDITNELKEAEEETQRFYRNVGNYPDIKPLETQLGDLKKQLAQLKYEGKENTEEFRELLGIASNMKDAIADVEGAIGAGASDTAQLDALIQGTGTVLQLYAQYSTISKSMGIENKELEKTFQILTMTMGALTAAQSVQNMLQKQSALMRGVDAAKTWLQVAAQKAQTTALVSTGVAQKAATAAQWAFNAAAAANPIGIIVAAIVAAVAAVYGLVKAFQAFAGSSEKQREQFKKTGEELEKLNKKYKEHIEAIKAAGAAEEEVLLQTLALSRDMANRRTEYFEQAKELYKEDSDEYKDAQEAKKAADEEYESNLTDIQNHLRGQFSAYYAQSLKDAYGEKEVKIRTAKATYEAQLKMIQELRDANRISAKEMAFMMLDAENLMNETIKRIEDADRKARASKYKQSLKTQLDEQRKAVDLELELIADKTARERAIDAETHKRTIEDLNNRLKTESGLTKKAKEAIRKQIQLQEQLYAKATAESDAKALAEKLKAEADAAAKTLALRLETVKEGSDAEFNLKRQQLQLQRDTELLDTKLTEEQKALIRQKYEKQDLELRKEHSKAVQDLEMEALQDLWQRKIDAAAQEGRNTLELELESLKAQLDALHQYEGESEAEFQKRQYEVQRQYAEKRKELADYEVQIEQAKYDAMSMLLGNIADLLETVGEENREAVKAAKILALAQMAIQQGIAVANAIRTATQSSATWVDMLVAVATSVGAVTAVAGSAISAVKALKLAGGGYVQGPGTATSDSVPAMLSNGESVMNARSTAMFAPLLSSINQAGGGVSFNPAASSGQEGFSYLAGAVAAGMKSVDIRVGVDEITKKTDSVKHIKTMATLG
jgi:hypothetical protein